MSLRLTDGSVVQQEEREEEPKGRERMRRLGRERTGWPRSTIHGRGRRSW